MDEKYINDLYSQLGGEEKFGKYEDFVSLITTDDNYISDFHQSFGEETLGSIEDFIVLVKKKDKTEDLVSTTEEVTTTVASEEAPMPQPSASLDSGEPLPEGFEFPTTVTPGILPLEGKLAKDVELDAYAITKEEKLSDIVRNTRFEDPITGTIFETGIPETYPETHNIYKRALQKAENDLLNQVLDEDEDMFSKEGEESNLYRQKRNKEFEIQQVQNRIDIIPEGNKDLQKYQGIKDSLTNELNDINKRFDEASKKRAEKDDTGQVYNPYTGEDIAKIDAPIEVVQSEENITTESNNLAKTKTNEQLEKSLIDVRFQLLNQGKRVSGQMQDVLDGMISTELMFFGGPTEEGFTNLPQAEDEILRKKPLKIYSEHPEAVRYNRLIDQYHALDRALRLNVDPTQIKTRGGSIVDFGPDGDFGYGLTSAIFGEQPARVVTPTTKMKATDFIEGLESAGFVNIPDKTKERIEKTFTEKSLEFGGELTGMVAELSIGRGVLTGAGALGKGRTAVKLKKGLEALGASTKNKYVKGGLKILGSGIDEAAVFAITGEITRKPEAYDPVFGAALGVGGEVANLGSKFISKLPIVKNISNKIKQLPFYNVGAVAGQSVAGAAAGTSVLYAAEIVDALITEDKEFAEIVKQVAGDDPEEKAMLLFTTMLAGNIAKSFPQFSKALRKDIGNIKSKKFESKLRDYVNKTKPKQPEARPEAPLELQESIIEVNKKGTPEQKQEAQEFVDGVETLQSVAEVKSLAESIESKELKELEQVELVNNISNQIVENPKITTTELALSQPEIKSIITSTPEEIKSLQASIEKQKNDGVISNKDAQLTIDAIKEVMNIKKSRFATITNVDKQVEGIGIQSNINKLKVEVSDLENQVLTGDGIDILESKKAEIESLEKQLDDFKNFREEPAVEVTEEVVTEEVVTPEVTEEILVEGKLEVDNLTEGSATTTKPIKIYKGIGGKKDLKGFRINAHEGAEGVFSAVDKSLAEEYGKEEGVAEVVLPEGTTVEVVEIDGKGMTLDQYRAAEVEAINNSDAQVVKLRTVDGVMKKGAKKQDQYIIKDETLIQELKKPSEVEAVEVEKVEVEEVEVVEDLVPEVKDVSVEIKNVKKSISKAKPRIKNITELRKIQNELKNFIKKTIPKSQYNKPEVTSMLSKIQRVTKGNVDKLMDEVFNLAVKKNVEMVSSDINKILDGKYSTSISGRRTGKTISTEAQDRLDRIKSMITEDFIVPAEILERYEELSQKTELTDKELDELVDIETAQKYMIANQYDNTNINKLNDLYDVQNNLDELILKGKTERRETLRKQHEYYKSIIEEAYKDITNEPLDLSAEGVESRRKETLRFENKQKQIQRNKVKKLTSKVTESLNNFMLGNEALYGLVDVISKSPGEMFGGRLQELITDRIDKSSSDYKRDNLKTKAILLDKLQEVYGKNFEKQLTKNRTPEITDIPLDLELHNEINKEINTSKNKNEIQKLRGEREQNLLEISQNQAYYLYNQYKDPANHPGFETKFGSDYKRIMDGIEKFLDPKVKEWADWQVDVFYPELYPKYNEVYKRMYRTNLGWSNVYGGRIYRKGVEVEPLDLMSKDKYRTSIAGASTKERTNNKLAIESMDGNDVLLTYVQDMNFFTNYAEPLRDIQKILKNSDIKNAIEMTSGKGSYRYLNEMIETIAKRGVDNSGIARKMNTLTNAFTTSRLGLNPLIGIKQLTSAIAFADDIGYSRWVKYGAKAVPKLKTIWKEISSNSSLLKDRYDKDIRKSLEVYSEGAVSEFIPKSSGSKMMDATMWFIKTGDKGGIMGGIPNYLYYKDLYKEKNPKATEKEIIDYAIRRFETNTQRAQQSSDTQDKDLYQLDKKLRPFQMFLTSPKQYQRKANAGIRQLYRKLKGMPSKGTTFRNLRTFLTYHTLLPMIFQYVTLGLPGLLRDFNKDDLTRLGVAGLIGNLNSLFLVGDIAVMTGDFLLGNPWAGQPQNLNAVARFASNITKELIQASKAKTEETKNKHLHKVYIELASLTGIPVANIKKLSENYYKVATGDVDSFEEGMLRLMNFSDYVIDKDKKQAEEDQENFEDLMKELKKSNESGQDKISNQFSEVNYDEILDFEDFEVVEPELE